MPEPIQIPNWDLVNIPKAGGTVDIRPHGYAESGGFYPCSDGLRMLHCTAVNDVVYILFKQSGGLFDMRPEGVYYQNRSSFSQAVSSGWVDQASIKLKGSKEVITNFLDVFLGAMACAGGPVAWGITGMKVAVLGGQIKQNYRKYEDALVNILAIKGTAADRMPVLYRTVLKNLLFGQLEKYLVGKSKENLAEMIGGKKIVGKLVGVALAAFGEDHFKQNLECMAKLLKKVLIPICTHVMDNKPALSETQIGQLADLHVIPTVAEVDNYPPSPTDAREIVRETARCWNMKTSFTKIVTGIEALK